MPAWTETCWTFTDEDVEAYHDATRLNHHFGLPLPYLSRVFSLRMSKDGLVERDPTKPPKMRKSGLRRLGGDFGNLVACRRIKSEHPEAWIWAERYTFTREPASPSWAKDQAAFVAAVGVKRLINVQDRALALGLNPAGKTAGRPDLAVFIPGGQPQWRFIELKKGTDTLNARQEAWLELLADVFGKDSAVAVTLVRQHQDSVLP